MILGSEKIYNVGNEVFFEGVSPTRQYGVTFEDDCTAGYFYAVNTIPDLRILNALHIYNVKNVVDRSKECKLQIAWNKDGEVAFLIINDYCHAIYDFGKRIAYSRNGFSTLGEDWSETPNQILTDDLLVQLWS